MSNEKDMNNMVWTSVLNFISGRTNETSKIYAWGPDAIDEYHFLSFSYIFLCIPVFFFSRDDQSKDQTTQSTLVGWLDWLLVAYWELQAPKLQNLHIPSIISLSLFAEAPFCLIPSDTISDRGTKILTLTIFMILFKLEQATFMKSKFVSTVRRWTFVSKGSQLISVWPVQLLQCKYEYQ